MPVTRKIFRRCLVLMFAAIFLASPHINGRGDGEAASVKNSADSVYSAVRTENDPESAVSPAQALSICSQHAPKCPLTAAGWPGEPDGWQHTGKRWIWVPGTPNIFGREVVWEYSQPYAGTTPAYYGQREDHYADQTNPSVPPVTYDWERWMQDGDNFRLMQLGSKTEAQSYLVGEADCSSGIFYPVVDHTAAIIPTPLCTPIAGAPAPAVGILQHTWPSSGAIRFPRSG